MPRGASLTVPLVLPGTSYPHSAMTRGGCVRPGDGCSCFLQVEFVVVPVSGLRLVREVARECLAEVSGGRALASRACAFRSRRGALPLQEQARLEIHVMQVAGWCRGVAEVLSGACGPPSLSRK